MAGEIAHRDEETGREHRLYDHLRDTARLARKFCEVFGAGKWGYVAGSWHDLGKHLPDFQAKLKGPDVRVDHAVVGALLAMRKDRNLGLPLAFVIAGHHTGLANMSCDDRPPTPLTVRLKSHATVLDAVLPELSDELCEISVPELPEHLDPRVIQAKTASTRAAMLRRWDFWIRFVFSSLVDADFLDTEEFFRPGRRISVRERYECIPSIRSHLDSYLDELTQTEPSQDLPSEIDRIRAEVLAACREKADNEPGLFSLTVPTGGGKTLSAMAFALAHAERHGLRRVIVVIPYTSIIEQNAAVYRTALGERNVVEHHSALDPGNECEEHKLACENWDAPVIVTTSVQFFESLFANRPSRCRKLHNIARSVIIFDEVQSLPVELLDPILEGLNELARHFWCSIVLSTATQPALKKREAMPRGLENVREIIAEPLALSRRLRRVDITWPTTGAEPTTWPVLADELTRLDEKQVLVVVHRRDDARELARLLPGDGREHLSALMCPRHRSEVLARVKQRLNNGLTCRLVSTQLIEAGVDIDFPVVYRALAGLDSIAQAAGRCNREGRLDMGKVVLFRAPTRAPRGTVLRGLETTESMLRENGGNIELDNPRIFEEYFRRFYFKGETDASGIQAERGQLNFANTASKFRMIEDNCITSIVIPYDDTVCKHIESCRKKIKVGKRLDRDDLRAFQLYTVSIYPKAFQELNASGAIETLGNSGLCILADTHRNIYSEQFGLVVGPDIQADATAMII